MLNSTRLYYLLDSSFAADTNSVFEFADFYTRRVHLPSIENGAPGRI